MVEFNYRRTHFHVSFFHYGHMYTFEFRNYHGGEQICGAFYSPTQISEKLLHARVNFDNTLRHFYADASYDADQGDDWLQSNKFARVLYRLLDVYVDEQEAAHEAKMRAREGRSVLEDIIHRSGR